ncbi:SEC-C metal-binding domain-containing protein [uncultured Shewanella sp.]|uniref:YecA family protein n=1 Tax=uncultured Shewanella sp. TaxID=173975 RepID=UPI002624A152|nr:SEC-C metal-binding domain-containing protein [uncultured Shewanella sp.]
MKAGRNDPCPCGSGNKYKRCCMDSMSKQRADIIDDLTQITAMNVNLSIDELNVVAQHKAAEYNHCPNDDFCGLSPAQMSNWLYAPFGELERFRLCTPEDLSACPVMRYLSLILEEAMQHEGSIKATTKGNLPVKLVKQASALLPEFNVSLFEIELSISEFAGSNEDKFNALHYARVLAELAGIIYRRSGRYHVKKTAQKQYKAQGISAFFLPMLEAAIKQYNWGYFDNFSDDIDVQPFWLFMLWRLQSHSDVDKLATETAIAFPALLSQCSNSEYFSSHDQLEMMISSRFIARFLQFWGFVTVDPRRYIDGKRVPREAKIQPLLSHTFEFAL